MNTTTATLTFCLLLQAWHSHHCSTAADATLEGKPSGHDDEEDDDK